MLYCCCAGTWMFTAKTRPMRGSFSRCFCTMLPLRPATLSIRFSHLNQSVATSCICVEVGTFFCLVRRYFLLRTRYWSTGDSHHPQYLTLFLSPSFGGHWHMGMFPCFPARLQKSAALEDARLGLAEADTSEAVRWCCCRRKLREGIPLLLNSSSCSDTLFISSPPLFFAAFSSSSASSTESSELRSSSSRSGEAATTAALSFSGIPRSRKLSRSGAPKFSCSAPSRRAPVASRIWWNMDVAMKLLDGIHPYGIISSMWITRLSGSAWPGLMMGWMMKPPPTMHARTTPFLGGHAGCSVEHMRII
mmetsp:Transcript_4170/g.8584  ORF Transcript_4170/g.8584 Transcript_4170/m.8584 type:complete len:305 (+) Transcript_4170:696-1610(+)